MFPDTAFDKSSILFLIELMLIWLVMTLFRFFTFNLMNVFSKLYSTDCQVIETDSLTYLARPSEKLLSNRMCRLWY